MQKFIRLLVVCAAGAAAVLALASDAAAECGGGMAGLRPAALKSLDGREHGSTAIEPDSRFDQPAAIVGLWKVTLTSGGAVIDVGFDAWHADGTETLNDSSPVSNHVCLGVWKQTGRRQFQLKHPALRFGADGSLIGTLVLRETNEINRAEDRFTGTFLIEFFDLDGNSLFIGAGEISGERITVE